MDIDLQEQISVLIYVIFTVRLLISSKQTEVGIRIQVYTSDKSRPYNRSQFTNWLGLPTSEQKIVRVMKIIKYFPLTKLTLFLYSSPSIEITLIH